MLPFDYITSAARRPKAARIPNPQQRIGDSGSSLIGHDRKHLGVLFHLRLAQRAQWDRIEAEFVAHPAVASVLQASPNYSQFLWNRFVRSS
jgi:hypothetical protein